MARDPATVTIYHITHVDNLAGIVADGCLHSDAVMAAKKTAAIGYAHIKDRRLKENRVACCGNRFVGEFVPFYYCPRSPMLYTINIGNTGRPPGCQKEIVHLVTTVGAATELGNEWAICNINAGVGYVAPSNFATELAALDLLNWNAICATYWSEVRTEKAAEFLVADSFPWSSIHRIGCHNQATADKVSAVISKTAHQPRVEVQRNWYY